MARCIHCQKFSPLISSPLDLCVDCIRDHFEAVKPQIRSVHAKSRARFGLPPHPPDAEDGLPCTLCISPPHSWWTGYALEARPVVSRTSPIQKMWNTGFIT